MRKFMNRGCFVDGCDCQNHLVQRMRYTQACLKLKQRVCRQCKEVKDFSEFQKSTPRKLGITCTCKPCAVAASQKSQEKYSHTEWEDYKKKTTQFKKYKVAALNELKLASGCCICGYKKCGTALEFHHVDAREKRYSIAEKTRSFAYDKLMVEISKCILVCSNCHSEIEEQGIDVSHIPRCKFTVKEFKQQLDKVKKRKS